MAVIADMTSWYDVYLTNLTLKFSKDKIAMEESSISIRKSIMSLKKYRKSVQSKTQ